MSIGEHTAIFLFIGFAIYGFIRWCFDWVKAIKKIRKDWNTQ